MYDFSELTEFFNYFRSVGIPSVDCIVYHKGNCVYRHMDGFSDYEKTKRMTGKEKYNIYSCTKPITCTAALQLYEKGLFRLDDPLYLYMPEFRDMTVRQGGEIRKAQNPILVRDLFTMTAGFTYDYKSEQLQRAKRETEGRCPTVETVKYLAKEPLAFEPGTMWHYSLCHDVLAALVEVLSGERFGDYVQRHIFTPLGMKDTLFFDSNPEAFAAQYRYNSQLKTYENCGKQLQLFQFGSEYDSGGAGCKSTVEDYIKFAEAMRKGDILLKTETTDMLATNRLNEETRKGYNWAVCAGTGYGLGVRCSLTDPKGDFGWLGMGGAYTVIDRRNELTLFYAQHVLLSPVREIRDKIGLYAENALK